MSPSFSPPNPCLPQAQLPSKVLDSCLRISIAVVKYNDQKLLGKEGVSFTLQLVDHQKSRQEPEAKTDAESLEKYC